VTDVKRLILMGLAALAMTCARTLHAEPSALTTPQAAYLAELQAQAQTSDLARHPMWRALLHYRVQPLTRQDRSLADDADFFLHPNGAREPAAELNATLAAFFDPAPRHALEQSAACRFVARYQWLGAQLSFDPARLPAPDCERYRQWRHGIQADRATLVFPSAYLNSPASMYGHTFLRLDPAPNQAKGSASPLLSYAVSYAAAGNEAEGFAFALKGLTGLYPGEFTNSPYYLRIRDYNDLENRDIWDYELTLTPPEIDRLLAHTWELGPTRFDYYFFDENCSYHLLSLIDAARPELHLSERFTWWAIPLDTVKAVAETPGLLSAVRYRPSNSTELRHRAALLGPEHAKLAQALAEGRLAPGSLNSAAADPAERVLILDTAERLVAFNATIKDSTQEITQRQRMGLLTARATLPASEPLTVPTPADKPTDGHGTARVDMLAGQRQGHSIIQLMARPAYHDLLDPQAGFQRGAAIEFFKLELSKANSGALQMERLTPVAITSLSPREPLLSARSWRVEMGLQRASLNRNDGTRPLGLNLRGGPGVAYELGSRQNALGYAFIDNHAQWDRTLSRHPWGIGSGVATGLIGDVNERWRLQGEVFARAYLARQPSERGASLASRVRLNADWNVHGRCAVSVRQGQSASQECLLGLQRYW
jgi:hypothetical protein